MTEQSPNVPFAVRTVSPMHCLLEKMLLLHELYRIPEIPSRYIPGTSRHLYDIVHLYEKLQGEGVKIDWNLLNKLRMHRSRWLGRATTVYRESCHRKLCFIPPFRLLGPLMDDYRRLRKEVIFDSSWEFPVLIGRIQQINASLNGIQWPYLENDRHQALLTKTA